MANLIWYRLEINTLGTDYDQQEVFNDLCNSFDTPKELFNEHGHTENYRDWDTITEDMREFSAKYPGVEFEFDCSDQDGSMWREWYKSGLHAFAEPEITYPKVHEGMYS